MVGLKSPANQTELCEDESFQQEPTLRDFDDTEDDERENPDQQEV